ncbi:carbohydrate esterase family 4 protein [Hyaloscypha hepaticicola]|uniref:Carbohydrate esterase family 4 protein n=1 Tax=Hyaloscypha hepaticicola TaxID=2082293 RepID=A0A2J6QGN1_9HELO|nr:carbohydrate esterase family 4 protein [Hyaloscypha hepaticicola]
MKVSVKGFLYLLWARTAQAGCTTNLLIDNYANYANNLNSLGQWTSDDGTTTNFVADAANKKITFTTTASSYFYTTFACEKSTTDQYTAITFPMKGPAGATFTIELQTSSSCSTTAYKSYFTTLTGITGVTQTYTIPLSSFSGANLNAIDSIVFESFSINGAWEIGQTQLVSANIKSSSGGSTVSSTRISSRTSSIITSSVKSSTSSTATSSTSSGGKSSTSVLLSASTGKSTTTTSNTVSRSLSTTRSSSAPAGQCTSLLIDDFASQSRLTFLFYNAMLQPSSDDGTMAPVAGRVDTSTSVLVANNHVTLTSASGGSSYWYSMFGCLKATNIYGGIGLTIKAPKGTTMGIELQTSAACSSNNPTLNDLMSTDLGWTFDGTEQFYTIPFSKFSGIDTDHLIAVLFSSISNVVTFGPMAFYCGSTGTAYPVPTTVPVVEPTGTVPATTGPSAFVIDTFGNADTNNLGFWHGGDDTTTYKLSGNKMTINMKGNSDLSWYTQVSNGCSDFTANDNSYLHIAYTGSNAFTVALQQHNPTCNPNINPFPYTWDSVEASRYSNTAKTDLYVPLSHFNINRTLTVGFALKGFYTTTSTVFSLIEIVKTVPTGFLVPSKLTTAPLIFACTRPNSFAFAIDDGDPQYAQRIVSSVAAAGIHVTFFTVGAALLDTSTNLTNVYKGMLAAGHQVAYHSYTHPPMEGLPTLAAIDWELNNDIAAVSSTLGITSTYFRPPFGTEGARIRQRLAAAIPGAKFVEWSVDVQDWLWALSSTPENQITNFQSDVNKGGNLVVMHYLYNTTVSYLPQFIAIAKSTGKQMMRVDQCLEDPNAPPL